MLLISVVIVALLVAAGRDDDDLARHAPEKTPDERSDVAA